jgi:hypothetical protein
LKPEGLREAGSPGSAQRALFEALGFEPDRIFTSDGSDRSDLRSRVEKDLDEENLAGSVQPFLIFRQNRAGPFEEMA